MLDLRNSDFQVLNQESRNNFMNDKIAQYVRTIPDFPEKGIMFRDITTLLLNPVPRFLAGLFVYLQVNHGIRIKMKID